MGVRFRGMLSAYFDIKPSKPPKAPVKQKKAPKAKPHVEPFDGCEVHAQFLSPLPGPIPVAAPLATTLAAQSLVEEDPPEYPPEWEEVETHEEDDTDSCVTYEDDASHTSDVLSTSPAAVPPDTFLVKRKPRVSAVPVYSGPELWYEDDSFIT